MCFCANFSDNFNLPNLKLYGLQGSARCVFLSSDPFTSKATILSKGFPQKGLECPTNSQKERVVKMLPSVDGGGTKSGQTFNSETGFVCGTLSPSPPLYLQVPLYIRVKRWQVCCSLFMAPRREQIKRIQRKCQRPPNNNEGVFRCIQIMPHYGY